MIGETVKHFRIEAQAGEGGMGIVYRATDTRLHRPVALKFLRRELIESAEARDRFTREARAAARLTHPNIAAIYDIMEHEGQSVIVMEWVDGGSLSGREFRTPREWEEALDILSQIASGLDAAHAAGVIHRDIKPSNILLTSSGTVKITDFGVARLRDATTTTQTSGRMVGTPSRMAPEQWAGEKIDHRVDIFALGTIAYELLTGQPPFSGETFEALGYQILSAPHTAPSTRNPFIPPGIDAAIGKCLAKSPNDRPETCSELVRGLRAGFAREATQKVPMRRRSIFRSKGSAAAIVVIGLLLVSVMVSLWRTDGAHNLSLIQQAVAAVQAEHPDRPPRVVVLPTRAKTLEALEPAAGMSLSLYRTFRDASGFSVAEFEKLPNMGDHPQWRELEESTQADFALVTTLTGPEESCDFDASLVQLHSGEPVWETSYSHLGSLACITVPSRLLSDLSSDLGWTSGGAGHEFVPALAFTPVVQKWLNRGHRQMDLGDFATAEEMYDSAYAHSDDKLILRYFIGQAKAAQGNHEEAIRDFKLALGDVKPPVLYSWDTLVTIPLSAHFVWGRIGDWGITVEVYEDTTQNAYYVLCTNPRYNEVHLTKHDRTSGFPVVCPPENPPTRMSLRMPDLTGLEGKNVPLRIIKPDGTMLGMTDPVRFDGLDYGPAWFGGLLGISFPRQSAGSSLERDSVEIFQQSGAYLGTIISVNSRYAFDSTSGILGVASQRDLRAYSTRPWGLIDSIGLPAATQDIEGLGGQIVIRLADGQVVWWDYRSKGKLLSLTTVDSTVSSYLEMKTSSRIQPRLCLSSGRSMRVFGQTTAQSSPSMLISRDYDADFRSLLAGDTLWAFCSDGTVECYDLVDGALLADRSNGPQWQGRGRIRLVALNCGILYATYTAQSAIGVYSRQSMDILWQRQQTEWSHPIATRDDNTIFLNGDAGAEVLDGATGKTLRWIRPSGRFLLMNFGDDNRMFVRTSGRDSLSQQYSMSQLNSHVPAQPIEEWEIQQALGQSALAQHYDREAIDVLLRAIENVTGSPEETYLTLQRAYGEIGDVDSAFWAACQASYHIRTDDPQNLPAAQMIHDVWGGSLIKRWKNSFSFLVFTPTSHGLRFYSQWLDPLTFGMVGDGYCIPDFASLNEWYQIFTASDSSTNVGYVYTDVNDAEAADSGYTISVSLWDLAKCEERWHRELRLEKEYPRSIVPEAMFVDSGRIALVTPHPSDDWNPNDNRPATIDSFSVSIIDAHSGNSVSACKLPGATVDWRDGLQWVANGVLKFSDLGTYSSRFAASAGSILLCCQDSITCFDATDGHLKWAAPFPQAESLVSGNSYRIRVDKQRVVSVLADSALIGLSLDNGTTLWKYSRSGAGTVYSIGGQQIVHSNGDTVLVEPAPNTKGSQSLPSWRRIIHNPFQWRRTSWSTRWLILRDYDSVDRSRFTLLDLSSGKVHAQFSFAVWIARETADDSTFYGLLPDGMLFRAPIDKLAGATGGHKASGP